MEGFDRLEMTKKINNLNAENPQYLTIETVEQCFVPNEVTHVDKQVCGNGFTTATFNILPTFLNHDKRYNCILLPNREAIMDKEKTYHREMSMPLEKRRNFRTDANIKFFYGGSEDTDFKDADILVFVFDSFISRKYRGMLSTIQFDKILFDEWHTVEKQSSFRKSLVGAIDKVKAIIKCEDVSITTVTATPHVSSEVDIQIINQVVPNVEIALSNNRHLAIERIKEDYKNGIPLVIGTSSRATIVKILKELGQPLVQWKVGKKLMRKLASQVLMHEWTPTKENPIAPITIISSAGYEGFDLKGYDGGSQYFFEDRSSAEGKKHENASYNQLIQFGNRVRIDSEHRGVDYFEYCRQEASNSRKAPSLKSLQKFVDEDRISNEKKMKRTFKDDKGVLGVKNRVYMFKDYRPFVIFGEENHRVTIEINKTALKMIDEDKMWDKNFAHYVSGDNVDPRVDKFFKDRNISFVAIDKDGSVQSNMKKGEGILTNKEAMVSNLLANVEVIEKYDLFGEDYLISHSIEEPLRLSEWKRSNCLKEIETYLRNKNYKGDYVNTLRQETTLKMMHKDSPKFWKVVAKCCKAYNKASIEKYGDKGSKKWRDDFKLKAEYYVASWCMAFANDKIQLFGRKSGHRTFNLATQRNIDAIRVVADAFNIDVTSVDIISAFPRIIYNVNGEELPQNFYGLNKKNKRKINKLLNNLRYEGRGTLKKWKQNKREQLGDLGIKKVIADWLVDEFSEGYRGDLYTLMSYYEMRIIGRVLYEVEGLDNDGVVTRHDEILIFNNKNDLTFLNGLFFTLGGFQFNGFFNVPTYVAPNNEEAIVVKLSELEVQVDEKVDAPIGTETFISESYDPNDWSGAFAYFQDQQIENRMRKYGY